ncbi:hypothetical protein [Bradyrhizobium altum]|nr:hypothetical protein [Bradyrhizobium altum]
MQHDLARGPRAGGISSTYLKLFSCGRPPMDIAAIVPDVAGEV